MDSEEEEEMAISFVTDLTFVASSTDWNLEVATLFNQLFSACIPEYRDVRKIRDLANQLRSLNLKMELASLGNQMIKLRFYFQLSSEWQVVLSLITQLSSMILDSKSELISLINPIVSLFNSKPDSESELVSLIIRTLHLGISVDSDSESTQESELVSLISQLVSLKPETELKPLIKRIISRFRSMNWEPLHFISFHAQATKQLNREFSLGCDFKDMSFMRSTTKIHFYCRWCDGQNHEEYDKVPVDVKHPLHPKHSLEATLWHSSCDRKECYCCNENTREMFYYCWACDFAMTLECVKKPLPPLSIDVPKWHDHPLALFPSQTPYPCSLCALSHSSCPLYICPPCDFVVHQNCLSLPKVIKISRHPHHRISFTPSFDQGDKCCHVCQRKINNDYGGYSCIKNGCSYIAHSRCATQKNVWDGIELEGVEEIEEEVLEPFVRISDGIIQHFSHQQHHLRLDENKSGDYDENKMCQGCITPIYFGNFYSCLECEFLIHEKCANLSRKIYHPIHPHQLNLVERYHGVAEYFKCTCSACHETCIGGFFYQCGKEDCYRFKLHVQCATTSEPLVHESHMHPLFLTSKPEERRECSVCKIPKETFNCVEGDCEFSLCFRCATIPQKVRYKHDKHILTLSYGEETSSLTYWCEVCEEEVNPEKRFYKCDEYCCVTLHMDCLIVKDLYLKPGSSWFYTGTEVGVLRNNHMSRPFCSYCKRRSPNKIFFQTSALTLCSHDCMWAAIYR